MAKPKTRRARPGPKKGSARRRRTRTKEEPKAAITAAPRPGDGSVIFAREHISYSALKQLQTCPLQYRLQRIERVTPSHRSPSLVLGGVYHRVLAHALLSLKKPAGRSGELTEEGILARFDDLWAEGLDAAGPPIRWTEKVTPDNQRDLGRAMVVAWHEQGLPLFTQAKEIFAVEEPFCVELVHSDGRVLKRMLAGIIDAIVFRADGTVAVIDHKTAKQRYSETYVDLDLQATAYTYAARTLGYGDCAFEFHTMLKRKRPELAVVPARRNRDSFDRLFWVARQAEKLIEAGAYPPAAPTWLCDSCEYGHACLTAHRPVIVPIRETPAVAS